MNQHLRDVLERADSWPPHAQEELRRAAMSIEAKLGSDPNPILHMTLRQIMLAAPLDGIDLDRRSTYPQVRDVDT